MNDLDDHLLCGNCQEDEMCDHCFSVKQHFDENSEMNQDDWNFDDDGEFAPELPKSWPETTRNFRTG